MSGEAAACLAWGEQDTTFYKFAPLGKNDAEHSNFDDVRSVAMSVAEVRADGLDAWLGPALTYPKMGDTAPLRDLIRRGLDELAALHQAHDVKWSTFIAISISTLIRTASHMLVPSGGYTSCQ